MLTDQSGQIKTDSVQNRQTKNGRSRSFPIHPDLLQVLRHMGTEKGPVFRGPRGAKLHDKTARGIFVSDVIAPLAPQFPKVQGLKTFADARFHSFRHCFVRPVLMKAVPERMVMKWLGHSKSEMIRHYYHLHDEDAKRCMRNIDFLGGASGCSIGETESDKEKEDAGPAEPEKRDNLDD